MSARQTLFVLLVALAPTLIAFAFMVLATVVAEKTMKGDHPLPHVFRISMIVLFVAGALFTLAATPTLTDHLCYWLDIQRQSVGEKLLFGLVVILTAVVVAWIGQMYRNVMQSFRDARCYRERIES